MFLVNIHGLFLKKIKKGITITNAFKKILKESNRKPYKIWVGKGSEFYNNSFKKWLKDNDIEMYSIPNERKSVVAERFVRTLKTKIYKYMTSVSENVYIDKLDAIMGEYNNTYHSKIKMKPIDVKNNTYHDSKKKVNNEGVLNIKLVIKLEFQNAKTFFLKGTFQIGLKKFLLLAK